MLKNQIELRNVRVNNLQDVNLTINHGQWVSICGVSGSGKSSFAIDTLYAEGQRRYVESLAPATRQFLQQLDRPDADEISGIPPAVCVRRPTAGLGPRTTVGSTTEAVYYLRMLFAKAGTLFCDSCHREVTLDDPSSAAEWLMGLEDSRFQVAFPIPHLERLGDEWTDVIESLKAGGFRRLVVDRQTLDLGSLTESEPLRTARQILVVVDRLKSDSPPERLRESLETAFDFGEGVAVCLIDSEHDLSTESVLIDGRCWYPAVFQSGLQCATCGREFDRAEPRLFSFTSPLGVCQACEGAGEVEAWDVKKIVPDVEFSLSGNAIRPWSSEPGKIEILTDYCRATDIPIDAPFRELTDEQIRRIVFGDVDEKYSGVIPDLRAQFEKTKSKKLKTALGQFRSNVPCSDCDGDRLNERAQAYKVDGESIADWCRLPVGNLLTKLRATSAVIESRRPELRPILFQIERRLGFLADIGLGYVNLNRSLNSLSRGEAQRVALTSSLSSTLVNMLYVLDEPSVGMHPHDVKKVADSVRALQRRGNTLVVVDHQETVIQAADRVIEFGPGAGTEGGDVVFDGTPSELLETQGSPTGDFLAGRRGLSTNSANRRTPKGRIKITGARGNNLKELEVEFPLGTLCVVTGVSGSGKSSLVRKTLMPAICQRKKLPCDPPLPFKQIFGETSIEDVVLIDHSPIGRSARSNPVTYVKAFDEIRKAFAETIDARTHNLKASHFSFNVDGGRCDKCRGNGQLSVDMQFLADVYMKCDLCEGRRYRSEVLQARYRGLNIFEVLNLTARAAFSFFRGHPKVQAKLKSLMDVGLGYIRLGQPATNLSSGEAQRLKLAHHLNASKRRSLFILDEPTSGLHMADVLKLVDCLEALIDVGHSMIVIEHNLNLIKFADWIVDLGPGAGDDGGQVIASGTPEQLAENPASITGPYLRPYLEREQKAIEE